MDYYNFTDPLALILQDYKNCEDSEEEKVKGRAENTCNSKVQEVF